jgi:hypothetical protein
MKERLGRGYSLNLLKGRDYVEGIFVCLFLFWNFVSRLDYWSNWNWTGPWNIWELWPMKGKGFLFISHTFKFFWHFWLGKVYIIFSEWLSSCKSNKWDINVCCTSLNDKAVNTIGYFCLVQTTEQVEAFSVLVFKVRLDLVENTNLVPVSDFIRVLDNSDLGWGF